MMLMTGWIHNWGRFIFSHFFVFCVKIWQKYILCYNRYVNILPFYLKTVAMITDRINKKLGLGNTRSISPALHEQVRSLPGVLRGFQQWVVSAHYVIDTDGAIVACNTDDDILRHAGPSSWDGKTNINRYIIGIEVIGPLPGFTDAQRVSLGD